MGMRELFRGSPVFPRAFSRTNLEIRNDETYTFFHIPLFFPVKNVTWILEEISRHNSTWWQFGRNPHQIPSPYHVIYPGFICFPCSNMARILKEVNFMEFSWHLLRKWWDFHRIWSHFQPNCRQKDMRKSLSHFLRGSQKIQYPIFLIKWNNI